MNHSENPKRRTRGDAVLLGVAVAFLLVTVTIVIANVVSRYVLHVSLTWSAELARYGMVWMAMLGATVLVRRDQHLTVDLIDRLVGARLSRRIRIIAAVASMTFFAVLLISSSILIGRTSGQVAASIDVLPMNLVYGVLPLSAGLMFVGSWENLRRMLRGEETAP